MAEDVDPVAEGAVEGDFALGLPDVAQVQDAFQKIVDSLGIDKINDLLGDREGDGMAPEEDVEEDPEAETELPPDEESDEPEEDEEKPEETTDDPGVVTDEEELGDDEKDDEKEDPLKTASLTAGVRVLIRQRPHLERFLLPLVTRTHRTASWSVQEALVARRVQALCELKPGLRGVLVPLLRAHAHRS